MGRTGIYACGESVSRHNSSELVVLFSLKQEASASIGGGTFTLYYIYFHQANNGQSILIILYHVAKLRAKKIPYYNYMQHIRKRLRAEKKT